MSRGRKAKTILNGSEWEQIFNKSRGFYFQYIIIQLGRKNKKLTDENADVLLQEIKQEKEELIAKKKLSREKPLAKVEKIPFEIPKNWAWCRLGEIITMIYGSGLTKAQTIPEAEFPVFGSNGIVGYYDEYLTEKRAIIIGRKGSSGALNISEKPSWTTDVAYYVEETENIDFNFLYFLLKSLNLDKLGKGIKPGLNRSESYQIAVPLPPLSEQKAISGFLQDFGKNALDESREYFDREIENEVLSLHQAQIYNNQITIELSHQLELVRQLRQAFLREAMQGKLVEQDYTDEPSEILLKRIKAEKEKLVAEKKIKKEKPLPEIKVEEIPFEIPSNWSWCRLSEIANSMSTGPFGTMLHQSDYVKKGIPLINPMNIVNGKIIPSEKMMVNEETKQRLNSYCLECGDVVIARRGEMGRCAVVSENENGWLCGTGSFFIRLSSFINRDYFVKVFSSDYSKSYLSSFSVGSTMDNLNHRILNSYPFPLPPLAEQKRIVEKLEKLMAFCDELEANIRESKTQAETLLQVALKEALEPKQHYEN